MWVILPLIGLNNISEENYFNYSDWFQFFLKETNVNNVGNSPTNRN